jgi:hypothetical protein
MKINESEAKFLGAKYFKPNKEVYLYTVRIINNKLKKESGIRQIHNYKITDDVNSTAQELQANVFFNNLRVNFSKKAGGVNDIRFRVRPTDNVVHEDLVEHWRRLFESPNATIRDIAWKLAKYAIYQSGMKQSNISFFKYIPPEYFSQIVNSALTNFDQNLDDPSVLNVIFKNLWNAYGNTYVPKINFPNQTNTITNDSGETIGFVLRRNIGANEQYFAAGSPPPFLKQMIRGHNYLMELVGFTGERQGGDAVYQVTSKLGDGLYLTEYHNGPSIYEDNNEYVADKDELYQYVNSSASYWTASEPLSPPAVMEQSIAPKSDTFADVESESNDDHSIDMDDNVTNSMIDNINDVGYEEGDNTDWINPDLIDDLFGQMTPQDRRKPDRNLDSLLKTKLAEIGVGVIDVDRIISNIGSPVAVAKVLKGVIEIAKGKADITTLPEEAAHMFVSMLDSNSPLMQKMMKEITSYNLYKDVVREYNDVYNGDVNKIKLEAIGKLVGNIIVNNFTGETQVNIDRAKNWFNRLWEVLKKILASVGIGELEEYASNNPSVFKEFAMNIVAKKSSKTLADTIIQNNFESIAMQMINQKYLTKECI